MHNLWLQMLNAFFFYEDWKKMRDEHRKMGPCVETEKNGNSLNSPSFLGTEQPNVTKMIVTQMIVIVP